jgi:hypothetical protein
LFAWHHDSFEWARIVALAWTKSRGGRVLRIVIATLFAFGLTLLAIPALRTFLQVTARLLLTMARMGVPLRDI